MHKVLYKGRVVDRFTDKTSQGFKKKSVSNIPILDLLKFKITQRFRYPTV